MDFESQQVEELKAEVQHKNAQIERLKKWNLMTDEQIVMDLKAEIERLKEALEALDDHGRASSFMETLKAQKAEIERLLTKHAREQNVFLNSLLAAAEEIERLKADHAIVRSFLDKADAKLLSHEKLITELCDALELPFEEWVDQSDLIQRARKATPK